MDIARSVAAALACLALVGCAAGPDRGGDADADLDADLDSAPDGEPVDPAWLQPDPEGRQTEGDVSGSPPEMVIVTSSLLAPAWEELARSRDLGGLRTDVVGFGDVQAGHEGRDEAEQLRAYLVEARAAGVRFVLLGGDAQVIPYRRVEDRVSTLVSGEYRTNGPTELYFAALDADWDRDGDGYYGEAGEDLTLEDLRDAELHVGRVPASDPAEVELYVRKVERFELEPGGREAYPLIMSDVASTIPLLGDIDAARALEITIGEVFPEELALNARRLYATEAAASEFGGEVIAPELVLQAFDQGYSLVFHNGHGSHGWLTDVIDTDLVERLDGPLPAVMLSCSCLAGNFADVAASAEPTEWRAQGPDDDSAGERFVLGEGGGVAYLGNTGVGLGPLGGSQLLHATLEGLFVAGLRTIGEAFSHGRAHMREVRLRIMGFDMPMNDETERWTQLIAILLGDPSIRPWTGPALPVRVAAPADYGPGFQELTAVVTLGDPGEPAAGATVMLLKDGDFLLRAETDAEGVATFRFIPSGPGQLTLQANVEGQIPARLSILPRT